MSTSNNTDKTISIKIPRKRTRTSVGYNLIGQWDPPILSEKTWSRRDKKVQRQLLYVGLIPLIAGIIILIVAFIFKVEMSGSIGVSVFMFIIAIGFFCLGSLLNKIVLYQISQLLLGNVVKKTILQSVSDFIQTRHEEIRVVRKMINIFLYEYRYIFPNDIAISSRYEESRFVSNCGYIRIYYPPSKWLEAKRIQKELDEFLGKKGLIEINLR